MTNELDLTGINLNPFTGEPYSEEYKILNQKLSSLPAYKSANDIMQKIRDNQVTLIISSTGSGKSVGVPRFVLHSNLKNNSVYSGVWCIMVSHPSRLSSSSVIPDLGVCVVRAW